MSLPASPQDKSLKYRTFAFLYRKFQLPLMKFIVKRMGGNQEAAEEVFSQTVEAALKGWYTFEHKSTYFTWVCRIALNKMADYYRHQINERSIFIAPGFEILAKIGSNQLNPEERMALDELKKCVLECIMLLPPGKRRLLYLKYWKDLSHKEIAKLMGLTERAVEGQLYRAKQTLKTVIQQTYPELAPNYRFLWRS